VFKFKETIIYDYNLLTQMHKYKIIVLLCEHNEKKVRKLSPRSFNSFICASLVRKNESTKINYSTLNVDGQYKRSRTLFTTLVSVIYGPSLVIKCEPSIDPLSHPHLQHIQAETCTEAFNRFLSFFSFQDKERAVRTGQSPG
jgi:hypothetical protein